MGVKSLGVSFTLNLPYDLEQILLIRYQFNISKTNEQDEAIPKYS